MNEIEINGEIYVKKNLYPPVDLVEAFLHFRLELVVSVLVPGHLVEMQPVPGNAVQLNPFSRA